MRDNEELQRWFGLSYASWLTMPRVFMEAMPNEWQQKMADLLNEYDEAIVNPPDLGTRVQVTKDGKMVKTPKWVINYRHPDKKEISRIFNHESR